MSSSAYRVVIVAASSRRDRWERLDYRERIERSNKVSGNVTERYRGSSVGKTLGSRDWPYKGVRRRGAALRPLPLLRVCELDIVGI